MKFKQWLENSDWLQDHLPNQPKPTSGANWLKDHLPQPNAPQMANLIQPGMGWKIHLVTGLNNQVRIQAYEIIKRIIAANGGTWKSKMLHGGDAGSKDITIYCGTRQEANKAAAAIHNNPELRPLLAPPSQEILEDDIELIPGTGVYGRFDAGALPKFGVEFAQYGCKGWSAIQADLGNMTWDKQFDKKAACQRAYDMLAKIYGQAFTG